MTPGQYPLSLYRGDTYAWRFRLWQDQDKAIPADLTGVEVEAEVREKSGGPVIATFHTTVELPNIIIVQLEAEDWVGWTKAKCRWDLQLTYPTTPPEIITVVAGAVTVTGDITDSTAISVLVR